MSQHIKAKIFALLAERDAGKSICPSEVARALDEDNWRDLMEPVRTAGFQLMEEGKLLVTQQGEFVDPANFKGPLRFILPLNKDNA